MSPISSTSGMKYSSISAGDGVDADDLLVALRVPVLGRVLDEVVADREHHVGLLEAGHRVVARLQADGAERARVVRSRATPLPMNVSATGMPVARANSRSAGAAPARTTPLPASATGLIAPRIRSAASQQLARAGLGRARGARRGSGSASSCSAITSSGSSMCVAPGFSDSATLNALRTTSGMISGALDARVPLRDRLHHLDDVDVLVRLLVHALEVALAGERHERRAVEEGVGDGGDEVHRARARACRGRRRRGRSAGRTCRPCRRRPARGEQGRTRSTSRPATR